MTGRARSPFLPACQAQRPPRPPPPHAGLLLNEETGHLVHIGKGTYNRLGAPAPGVGLGCCCSLHAAGGAGAWQAPPARLPGRQAAHPRGPCPRTRAPLQSGLATPWTTPAARSLRPPAARSPRPDPGRAGAAAAAAVGAGGARRSCCWGIEHPRPPPAACWGPRGLGAAAARGACKWRSPRLAQRGRRCPSWCTANHLTTLRSLDCTGCLRGGLHSAAVSGDRLAKRWHGWCQWEEQAYIVKWLMGRAVCAAPHCRLGRRRLHPELSVLAAAAAPPPPAAAAAAAAQTVACQGMPGGSAQEHNQAAARTRHRREEQLAPAAPGSGPRHQWVPRAPGEQPGCAATAALLSPAPPRAAPLLLQSSAAWRGGCRS